MTIGKFGISHHMTFDVDERTPLQRHGAAAVENGIYRRNGDWRNQAPCSADALADAIRRYAPAGTEVEIYSNGALLSLDGDSLFVEWYRFGNLGYNRDRGAGSWLAKADAETLEEWRPPVVIEDSAA